MSSIRLNTLATGFNREYAEALLRRFAFRCKRDRITVSAGNLAYVTLLSLVPFIMVFFTIMSAFPAFKGVRSQLEDFIFNNFVPTAGDTIQKYIGDFVGNASEMGAVGILSLLVVALLMILNIDKTLNAIWRTPSERPSVYTFAIYWSVITLGPLLMGASVVVSSYLVGLANYADEYTLGLGTLLLKLVPSLSSFLAFVILYTVVPNKTVRPKYALIGAFIATALFEFSKVAFAAYITNVPSYQLIYGALAVIPILFIWVYLSWIIVLFGAEITCTLDEVKKPAKEAGS